MTSFPDTLAQAQQYQQAGNFRQAEELCRRLLQQEPANIEALFLLGATCRALGKLDEAVAIFRQVLRLRPDAIQAHKCLGVLLSDLGRLDEAVTNFREGMRLGPDADTLNNLGVAHARQEKLDEATHCFQEALRLRPGYAAAYCNLGNVFRQQQRWEEATAAYQHAVQLNPSEATVHNNLASAMTEQGRLDEAIACIEQALRLRPGYAEAHNNLGIARARQDRLDEAVAAYRQAMRLNPRDATVHNHLGMTYQRQGKLDEAQACYEEALRLRPDYTDAHGNRAMLWLLRGNFEQGWPEYEWRWRSPDRAPRPFAQPAWDGSPLKGRTLLVHMEQGLGDILHFIRCAAWAGKRGGRVVVESVPSLVPLLTSCPGLDQLVPAGSVLPPFDVHAPLMNLPALFGTTLATIPADVPYLFADADRVAHWQSELAPLGGFRVGINWAGNPRNPVERYRTVPLLQFEPLARVPGVRLVSLQKGAGREQLTAAAGCFAVTDLGPQLDEDGAFLDTAAVMKNLDLVITSDTSIAHLAGALGVPVWVAIPQAPEWRWLLGREDSPWYPSMRLFRQERLGDWGEVIECMRGRLRKLAAAAARARPILIEVAPGELIDKITILEIKNARLSDAAKLSNVRRELATLAAARDRALPASAELTRLAADLRAVNEALWEIEDDIRRCEQAREFGPRFIELARSVYRQNDRRAALKRRLNEALGSALIEEKSYAPYE